jgi:hypothetical protein
MMNKGSQGAVDRSVHLAPVGERLDDRIGAARPVVLRPTVAIFTWKVES